VSEVLVPGMVVERYGPTLVHAEVEETPASKLYNIVHISMNDCI
jgi:hypothetical protein